VKLKYEYINAILKDFHFLKISFDDRYMPKIMMLFVGIINICQ
jgi:hypothetical protein